MTRTYYTILNISIIQTILVLSFALTPLITSAQNKIPKDYCISTREVQIFNGLNQLRSNYGQPKLKLSASLSYVAYTHVDDLLTNRPDTSICGLSSWSDKGKWKACCYNPYILNEKCMWAKPKELTPYPYRGYEMVTFFEDTLTVDSIILLWSSTREALDMILTREKYKQKRWVCMGVGMNDHYVSVWFGQRADLTGKPRICDTDVTTTPAVSDTILKKSYYYLIFGSFDNLRDAREALKNIQEEDFPEAGILDKNKRIRIYLKKYNNLKEATFAKQNLPRAYQNAWILKE